jgi:hypothetical protein
LTSVGGPHDSAAFSGGWLAFNTTLQANTTVVQFDADGGGNQLLTLATLSNVLLQQSDTANYVL